MHSIQLSQAALNGIDEARSGNTTCGGLLLEEALGQGVVAPPVKAWYAYCLAREGRDFTRAHRMCLDAIQQSPGDSDLYLALGRLYLVGKRRKSAVDALERGLRLDNNRQIRNLLESIGMRKRPVFPFLNRDNLFNVSSGRLLTRWGMR